jgi:alpha-1,6-mannosyltransferase
LAAAWRLGPVRRGLLGTVAIEIGSFTPAYLPRSSPLWEPLRSLHLDGPVLKVAGTVIVLVGIWLLVDGWFRLRRTRLRPAAAWPILVLWSLPFLFGPPIFSHDAYSYAAQGWMVHNLLNPYDGGPGLLPGAFADQVAWVWRYTPAPYGPLSLQISHGLVDLSGFHPSVAAELMRAPALLGVGLIVGLLPRIARRVGADPARVAWFACLNPLLVIDYVGGAHNDALMMGLVVTALWIGCHRAWWPIAAAVVGVAATIKQPAFLAAVVLPFLHTPGRGPTAVDPGAESAPQGGVGEPGSGPDPVSATGRGRVEVSPRWRDPRSTLIGLGAVVASLIVAVAVFIAVSAACGLGYGWIHALGVPGSVTTVSPTSLIGEALQWLIDPGNRNYILIVQSIGTTIAFILAALVFVIVGRRQPLGALALAYLAIAALGPALHSWYILWGGLLLPLTLGRHRLPRVAVGVTVVLLSYAAFTLAWRNGAWALGVAAAALLVWFAIQHEVDHSRPLTGESDRARTSADG